jgi:fucose permease
MAIPADGIRSNCSNPANPASIQLTIPFLRFRHERFLYDITGHPRETARARNLPMMRTLTGSPQLRKDDAIRRTFAYYLLFICLGLDAAILGPTLPALAGQTGTRLGQMGMLFFAGSIGYVLGTTVGGRIFDRVRGHPVLGAAQLVVAGMTLLIPFLPWLWILLLVLICKGFAGGLINTGANTLLVWTHKDKVGPFMNGLHFFFGLGAFLAPFLVAQVAGTEGGYRWAFWIMAAAGALVGLRMLALSGSPQPVRSQAAQPGEGTVVRMNYPLVAAAAIFLFFYVGAELSFGGWIYTYTLTLHLAGAVGAAYLTSGFWLSFTVGRLISIPFATRFTPLQIIPAAILGCLLALSLPVVFPGSLTALWITTIALGFCMAPVWPTGFTLAGRSLRMTASASSLILLGDSFGGMVLPWLVGLVIDQTGPAAMVYLVLVSLAGTALAFIAMLRLRPATRV